MLSTYKLEDISAQYPVIIGEFGADSFTSQADVTSMVAYWDSLGINWIAWLFNKAACPCLLNDNTSLATAN